MNFLAHCALADEASDLWQVDTKQHQGLLAGAVIADFTKGRINPLWPDALQAGIRLHRRIDAVSNQHPGIRTSCQRFPQSLRRFAPIFIDILADHYLSLSWQDYTKEDLGTFTPRCYQAITEYQQYLPQQGQSFVTYMRETNLLGRYHDWATIERALLFSLKHLGREELGDDALLAAQQIAAAAAKDFPGYYTDFRQQLGNWSSLLTAK